GGRAASAREMGGSDGHPTGAAWCGQRNGGRERGAGCRRRPEPGVPLERTRLAPPEALGRRLRPVGRADGGRATLRPAAPPRPVLGGLPAVGGEGGPERRRAALGAAG